MKPIDLTTALKATDGDFELLKDVVDAFLEEYPTLMAELEPAILKSDLVVVQRASHTIKGTLRLFGDVPAQAFAERLEEMAQSGALNQAQETFESLRVELSSMREQLVEAMKAPNQP